jgi:predicted dinucleotide-binding enzyme
MSTKRIAILGSGAVGDALAAGFLISGYHVVRGTREPTKLAKWKESSGDKATIASFAEAAAAVDTLVLAVKGTVAEDVIRGCGPASLSGKTIIDACNPISDAVPVKGVLSFFTKMNESLMERLQLIAPSANFVKAFSCVGNGLMYKPSFAEKPTMFICGNNSAAKKTVSSILGEFGWDVADMGAVEAARAIEPLCILWCIPGFKDNSWFHAFRLLKQS